MPSIYNNRANKSAIRLRAFNAFGSATSTRAPRYSNVDENTATEFITYTDSATNGASFTVLKDCWITGRANFFLTATTPFGWAKNVDPTTTSVSTITSNTLAYTDGTVNKESECTFAAKLVAGDVLRFQSDTGNTAGDTTRWLLELFVQAA